MLNIYKEKTQWGYKFTFDNGEEEFNIIYAGNLDLYWCINRKNFIPVPDDLPFRDFLITKENHYIYSLFEKIYFNIENCNIFSITDYEYSLCENIEEKRKLENKLSMAASSYQKKEYYKNLFHDYIIEWHSDDDMNYDDSSFIAIEKNEDSFLITFNRSKEVDNYLTYEVRFRNSGSYYGSFNQLFMDMYKELITYNPEYHQINFEEYAYQKKIKNKNGNVL